MSLINTESFVAFQRWTGDDAYNPTNTALRIAMVAAFQRAGYVSVGMAQTSVQTSGGFVVRPDPIYPDRAALVYSSGNTANSNQASTQAGLRKPLLSHGRPVIGGFSLYIPPEYVPATTGPVAVLNVHAMIASDTSFVVGAGNTVFVVYSDLTVRTFSGVAQSTKALVPGRLSYLEYRIADNEVRVWIDEVLVLQQTVSLAAESIGFVIYQNNVVAPNSFMQGAAGRWAISNWYNLAEDAQAPNSRLGATTRVIGVRPDADVSAQFLRPPEAASNAAVAGQDLVDNPTMSLQSTTVGDRDVYSTSKDTGTATGRLVHAVATKVLASNLESSSHSIRPLVLSSAGTEREDPRPREFRQFASPFGTRNMYGIARRQIDGKLFAVGAGPAVFATEVNGNASSPWTLLFDGVNSTVNGRIAFRPDGYGVIVRTDTTFQVIPPGSDTPGAPFASTYIFRSIICLPDGTLIAAGDNGRIGRCTPDKDPRVIGNWQMISVTGAGTNTIQTVLYHPILNRLVAVAVTVTFSFFTSDDGGVTWVARTTAIGAAALAPPVTQLMFDGSYFLYMSQNTATANYIKRSSDGVTWDNPVYNTNNGSTQGVAQFTFGDTGLMLMQNGVTTTITSTDGGANWRRISTLAGQLRGACIATNGDWMMVGDNGILYSFTSILIDSPLVPLAGYSMSFNSSTTNPDTGAPWTPAEAAAVRFGMRVTS